MVEYKEKIPFVKPAPIDQQQEEIKQKQQSKQKETAATGDVANDIAAVKIDH